MALVLAGSASRPPSSSFSSNPTASLASALGDFEAVLSDKERLTFRGNYGKPGPSDVLAFVSRVDADNKGRGRRCVAPRLCTFLDSIVQFTGIVDTFVQANPAMSALVWGGAKTAILAASNSVSYFDKVTNMLMGISRVRPSYQQFGELYPGSARLQAALCDYYATIVRICTKIVDVSRRSGLSQFLTPVVSPFEADFRTLLENLAQAGRSVDIEIAFASQKAAADEAQLADIERKESTAHRRVMSRFQDEWKRDAEELRLARSRRQIAKLRLRVLDSICPVNYSKPWRMAKQQHLPGTADWFLQDDAFKQWFTSSDTAILWCPGGLGSGKTVFASNVVARISEAKQNPSDLVSYFFCRDDETASLKSRNIIGGICRQLLSSTINELSREDLERLLDHTNNCSIVEIVHLMLDRLDDSRCYLILDGLDECEMAEVSSLAKALKTICCTRPQNFHILCSGRPELEPSLFRHVKPTHRMPFSSNLVDRDIEQYIKSTLDQHLEDESLIIADPNLILDIVKAVRSGAHGMFLWARIVLDELCHYGSDSQIRAALADLPRELFQLYDHKMTRIKQHSSRASAIKALEICYVTKRALNLEEMREILSVEIGQKSLAKDAMMNDMHNLISTGQGMLVVDEQDWTIHLIHHSIKQFLVTPQATSVAIINEEEVEMKFGCLCLTYIDFSDFERQVTKKVPNNLKVDPSVIVSSSFLGSERKKTAKIAQKLLRLRSTSEVKSAEIKVQTLQSLSGTIVGQGDVSLQSQYNFLAYAREYWIYHLWNLHSRDGHPLWKLFFDFVYTQEEDTLRTARFFTLTQSREGNLDVKLKDSPPTLWDFALEHDHPAVFKFAVDSGQNMTDAIPLLVKASTNNKARLKIEILKHFVPQKVDWFMELEHKDYLAEMLKFLDTSVRDFRSGTYRTPIWLGSTDIRIQPSDLVIVTKTFFVHALQYGKSSGREDIVCRLIFLARGMDITFDSESLLRYAVEAGHLQLIADLEHTFVKFDAFYADDLNTLGVAAVNGRADVVQILKRSSPHSPAEFSPFATAAWLGDDATMQALCARWSCKASDQSVYTPLQAAARNGRVNMLRHLLKINTTEYFGKLSGSVQSQIRQTETVSRYPLFLLELACQSGSVECVVLLSYQGITPAVESEILELYYGTSPLSNWAHSSFIQLLHQVTSWVNPSDLHPDFVSVVEQFPSTLNGYLASKMSHTRAYCMAVVIALARKGDRRLLSRAVQLISSKMPRDEYRDGVVQKVLAARVVPMDTSD